MNHCREAAHFFICVYVILLGIASVYLSVGFPCNPWADLGWSADPPGSQSGHIVLATKPSCWRDCEAYALRLQLIRNPSLADQNRAVALIQHLLTPIQPNPFCYSQALQPLLVQPANPFCDEDNRHFGFNTNNARPDVISLAEFKLRVRNSSRLNSLVVVALCLDCVVVSLVIVLIYIAQLESQPYAVTFPIVVISHVISLFLSTYASKKLPCYVDGLDDHFCDGSQVLTLNNVTTNVILPDKASGVSNYEISLIVKNINIVCIIMAGLVSFSIRRVFDDGLFPPGPPGGDRVPAAEPAPAPARQEEGLGERLVVLVDNSDENP